MLSQRKVFDDGEHSLHLNEKIPSSSNNEHFELLGNTDINMLPCLKCTGSAPQNLLLKSNAINELCGLLCNNDCRQPTPVTDFQPNRKELDLQPPLFLNGILRRSESYEDCRSRSNNCADNEFKSSNVDAYNIEMLNDLNRKLEMAEALSKLSEMTSTSQIKQRLAARKLEIEDCRHHHSHSDGSSSAQSRSDYEPPRDVLLYLVRMGSFNSAPKIQNIDSQDDDLELPKGLNNNELLQHVKQLRGQNQPSLLSRYFLKPLEDQMFPQQISEGLRCLNLESDSKVCSASSITVPSHIRLLQWNILSQSLGQNNDGFVQCPDEALMWENRKFLIVQEILQTTPDIICLQEVDHFKFLQTILGTQNYNGIFFPKPDSPCLYIEENNGPDGCAIFYKSDKFEMINFDTRVLEVWRVQSNQVAIAANFRAKVTGKEVCVCTTHLKARHGSLLSKLRNEQGRDLIRFLKKFSNGRPVLLCGDFNAEPVEPVYATILTSDMLSLSSAYADIKQGSAAHDGNSEQVQDESGKVTASIQREPSYTTWKIREDGEVCHTIDYIFYSNDHLKVKNCLEFPQDDEIGENRTPSFQYPSDHFSLVCDFEFIQ